MKIPSTPTATAVLAMHGISSRRPPLATPPPSSYMRKQKFKPLISEKPISKVRLGNKHPAVICR